MSRISKYAKAASEVQKLKPDEAVRNFMGGTSYKLNPLDTLKMIAASSIFGEASYYRKNVRDGMYSPWSGFEDGELVVPKARKTTTDIFTEAIDASLDYDFGATLELAVELRETYFMRLNPQVIMVRAAVHPKRAEWTKANPGKFAEIQKAVMKRADEPATQLSYYTWINKGKKNNIPSILKRSIADKLSSLSRYQINKYKNAEFGMINAVRVTHANSPILNELMKTGTVQVKEDDQTWEQKRSAGMSWKEILDTTDIGHMALLRNIRNVFTEIDDMELCKQYMAALKDGVKNGKQFPFRYESAYRTLKESKMKINHLPYILDTLEECIDIAIECNLPKLPGKTMCLSDNSGSAWGAVTSEFGTAKVANIDNLSAVIAAKCSDEGYVGKFGDKLIEVPISKRNGALVQATAIDAGGYTNVGGSTEGGIWIFFRDAIKNKTHYDNIFIFSDQQAGTGGLYGTYAHIEEYKRLGYGVSGYSLSSGSYINVYKLILEYRKKVNPKVNVFSVQTAGYDNILIPQMTYRCAMLTGWTGKEIAFAADYIKRWDEVENRNKVPNKN